MSNNREKKYWSGGVNPLWLLATWPMLILSVLAALLRYPHEVSRFLWNSVHPDVGRYFDLYWIELVMGTLQRLPYPIDYALNFIAFLGMLYLIIRLSERFVLTEDRLLIRKGILFRSEDEIELYRVMDVRSRRGPIQFLLNVGNVTVMSSDASGTVVLRGIFRATRVRDLIRKRAEDCKSRRGFRVLE